MAGRQRSWVSIVVGIVLLVIGVVGFLSSEDGGDPVEAATNTDASESGDGSDGDAVQVNPSDTDEGSDPDREDEPASPPEEPSPSEPVDEPIEEFMEQLQISMGSGGDRTFGLVRLGQATIDRYGRDQCEATFAELDDQFEFTIQEIGEPEEVWLYTTDGRTAEIADAIPVEIERVIGGQTIIQELHLSRADDGTLRWYSDCGEPVG